MKLALTAICASFLFGQIFNQNAFGQTYTYKVHILEEGETLSELLHRENYTPLYGEDRWVEKILKANHLTLSQAKEIKKGRPIILPSKEMLAKMDDGLFDKVELRQSAVSHGLFGNKISAHQNVEVAFQYHMNSLKTSETDISSQENYGVFLSYEDNNPRSWKGFRYNPQFEIGTITHGTNQTGNDRVLSYDPTFTARARMALRAPSSTVVFGPSLSWENASRGYVEDENAGIRRDHLLWAGAFASKTFHIPQNISLEFEASLQKSFYNQEAGGMDDLDALKSELGFEVNLTRNYFLKLFSNYETYQNENLENAVSTGARLSYQIQ